MSCEECEPLRARVEKLQELSAQLVQRVGAAESRSPKKRSETISKSTILRVAGNIAAGLKTASAGTPNQIAVNTWQIVLELLATFPPDATIAAVLRE